VPSEAEIEAGRTPAGGYDRATLASWGVPWPPPKNWKKKLIAGQTFTEPKAARKPKRAPRTGMLTFRATDDEKAMLDAGAAARGFKTRTEYLRWLLDQEGERHGRTPRFR
jgi:hypothetical protein